jgi:hypothetical protein
MMKVGDLVRVISAGDEGVVIRRNGIVIKVDMGRQMEPYNIPACLVHWPDNVIRWEFFDVLEVITK